MDQRSQTPEASPARTNDADVRATRWWVDPDRSRVTFQVPAMWGLTTVKGHFERLTGTLDLRDRPAVELAVDATSIDTGNRRRDKHLRSPDFFGVDEHPQVRFIADTATVEAGRLEVHGKLHARGSSMPLTLGATIAGAGEELVVEATAEIDQRRLGMTWSALGMVGAPSVVRIAGRLVRESDVRSRPGG